MLNSEFRLLNAFLQNPSKELYGREIERLTETNHERAIVYLGKLTESKVLFREKKGKQMFYRLNKQSDVVQKALSVAEMERRMAFIKKNKDGFILYDLVSQVIKEFRPAIYFVILFGSVARGHATEGSDIDVLFVLLQNGKTESGIKEIIKKKTIITGKEFSFHPVTLPELKGRWSKEPIYKNIWDERIVFFGEENFWNFVLKEGEPHG
ncbi:nucleotidyltransferase domain-containing protein [Candidatus Micrarchaeota archaeon]|nr:nucleotidyltransferase domain-containing protein [Candidatus Micrarchaeota archaeon]